MKIYALVENSCHTPVVLSCHSVVQLVTRAIRHPVLQVVTQFCSSSLSCALRHSVLEFVTQLYKSSLSCATHPSIMQLILCKSSLICATRHSVVQLVTQLFVHLPLGCCAICYLVIVQLVTEFYCN